MRIPIIGVIGPANAAEEDIVNAFEIGRLIAIEGWILLSGGMNEGVMDAVNRGAKSAGGLTVGIIATKSRKDVSDAVDIPIITNLGSARNYINVLSSDVLICCGMSSGTASEVGMAIREEKSIILLTHNKEGDVFFKNLGPQFVYVAENSRDAFEQAKKLLS